MMRSLYAGVSGLQTHQVKMDVISNNISNINTVGFKSGRVNFQESLTQVISSATRPTENRGGLNPEQIGLGSAVSSISTNFTQGNLETTGNTTDLAIEGSAFFILNGGGQDYYTRAGNFVVDGDGNLTAPQNGFIVQGKLADSDGVIQSGAKIEDIVLPFGQKAPAYATKEIQYVCNLNSDTEALKQIWSMDLSAAAAVTGTALSVPVIITSGTSGNNTLSIALNNPNDPPSSTVNIELEPTSETKIYSNVSDLVDEINSKIALNTSLAGKVTASVEDLGSGNEGIKITTVEKGGSSTSIQLEGTAATALNLPATRETGTTGSTELNDLSIVSEDLVAGDVINISGTKPDGNIVSEEFIYGTNGTTVAALIARINEVFTGATASFSEDGKIELTDIATGETLTTISLTGDADNDGSVVLPSFVNEQTGRDPGEHTASITVYDSKGGTHTVSLKMTNASSSGSPNIWNWTAEVDDGLTSVDAGGSGTIRFNTDGSLSAFTIDDAQPLTFDPGNGSELMKIDLNAGESGSFAGITQLESPTTTVAKYQDGYGMGNLQTVSIDSDGMITGHFSNGVSQTLAQIALAQFNNPSGLVREGDNMYSSTANSGTAVKGVINGGIQGSISSGALEMSNVDLAQEFTDMIVAQRGFQANSRVITTADTLLQEIVQLKR